LKSSQNSRSAFREIFMRNLVLPADTTIEAARVQFAVLRRLGFEHSLRMALQLSDNVRELSESGIRQRHPNYSPRQVQLTAIRARLGEDLFQKAFGQFPMDR
jgi:hypothetical protein